MMQDLTLPYLKSPGFLSIIFESELKFGYKRKGGRIGGATSSGMGMGDGGKKLD
jgi:hypothetical protein